MSMTAPIEPPDPHRCPVCAAPVTTARCAACGADLGTAAGQELWWIDQELARLAGRRAELIEFVSRSEPVAVATVAGAVPAVAGLQPAAPTVESNSAPTGPPGLPTPPWTPGTPPPHATGPEVSSILLGLGVALLVIAALVFAAVSWSRLGAAGQGALLIGLTLAAGASAQQASKRRLTGTAEALGILTIVLGPLLAQAVRITLDLPDIDDRSWSNLATWSWWPGAMVVIGVAAIAFGRAIGVRGSQYVGVVLTQLGPAVWIALAPISPAAIAAALAVQAGLVATAPAFTERDRQTGALWLSGAITTWVVALLVGIGQAGSIDDTASARIGATLALAVCATVAGTVAWRWRTRTVVADLATVAATIATFLAIGRGFAESVPAVAWWPIMGAVAAAGLVIADLGRGLRVGAVRGVCWVATAVAALPLLANGIAVLTAAGSVDESWHGTASGAVVVDALTELDPAWVSAFAGLLALAAAVAAGRRQLGRNGVVAGGAVLAALGAVLIPPLAGGSLGLVVAVTLAGALGLAAMAPRSGVPRVVGCGALGVFFLGLLWAVGSLPLVLTAGAVGIALGAAAVLHALDHDDPAVAVVGAGLGALAVVGEAAALASSLGATDAWAAAAAAAAAAVAGAALPHLDQLLARRESLATANNPPLPPPPQPGAAVSTLPFMPPSVTRSTATTVLQTAGWVLLTAHVWALLAVDPSASVGTAPITLALATGVVAFASIAMSTRRTSSLWWGWAVAAGIEALAILWVRLAEADVATLEAYTLPLACLLGASAWLAAQGRDDWPSSVDSWKLEGPALAMALGPTVLLALGDVGVTRQVIGLALGALLLGAGATLRRRAPLDVGAVAVVVLGLQALLPYADQVPRWVSLGTVGALLMLLGATFEQRRRDLRQAKRLYSSLL